MVAPYATSAVNNGNKCPHGLPPGACPICSGMGGGGISKDRNKPRVPGEMSYNECMAAWIKIQAAKEAKIQAEIDKVQNAQAQAQLDKIMTTVGNIAKTIDNLAQKIEQIPIVSHTINIIKNVIIKPILNLIAKIPQAINFIQGVLNNIARFISSVSEKLASIFGEVKNFIDSRISQPLKKAIKSVLSFFTQGEEEENEEVEKLKSREIKKVLKGLFRIKNKDDKKIEEEEKDNN